MRLIVLRICDVSFGKMKEGKQKCRILKTIRKQIAEANDIKLVTSKCRYRGDCLGTCPKCEAEVRYLEEQLLFRQRIGLAVKIVGVSLGMSTMGTTSLYGQKVGEDSLKNNCTMLPQVEVVGWKAVRKVSVAGGIVLVSQDRHSVSVEGIVMDKCGHPIIGAEIVEKGTAHRTLSDLNGRFILQISGKRAVLKVNYPGMKTKSVSVRKRKGKNIKVVLYKNRRVLDEIL